MIIIARKLLGIYNKSIQTLITFDFKLPALTLAYNNTTQSRNNAFQDSIADYIVNPIRKSNCFSY